jgi:hypothetical protein
VRSAVGQRGFDSVPLVASATSPIDQTVIFMRIQGILVSLTFVAGVVRLNIAKSQRPSLDLEFRADRPNVLWPQR